MKSFLVLLTLLTLGLSIYFTWDRFERVGVSTMITSDGNSELRVSTKGKIRFTDDESGIQSISKKGFIRFKRDEVKFSAVEKDGQIVYEISDDGKELDPSSEEGRKVLADAIRDLLETGYDAEGRAERLFAKSGTSGVLEAAADLKNDFIKSVYMEYLLKQPGNNDSVYTSILAITNSFGSSFEKAKLLRALAPQYGSALKAEKYLQAIDGIDGEFEQAGVIKHLLKSNRDTSLSRNIIPVVANMKGDFEKSGILRDLASEARTGSPVVIELLEATRKVEGDFEKDRLMKILSEKIMDSVSVQTYLNTLGSVHSGFEKKKGIEYILNSNAGKKFIPEIAAQIGQVDGDFEKVNLVKKMIDIPGVLPTHFSIILSTVNNISTDFERQNIYRKLADKAPATADAWISLIESAGNLGGDFERANLLTHFASRMPQNEETKTAYTRVAKTIGSDHDFGRAMKALE